MSRHRKRNSTQPVACARPRRSHRAPPALDAKIFEMGKRKTIQHYKLSNMIEKDFARERHSSDDSGYEESDRASTVSPNPSLYEGMSPLPNNSNEDLRSSDQLPTCVSEAGQSDSDSNADSLEDPRKPAGKRGRRPYKQAAESKVDYLEMDRSSGEEVHPSKRMLMKDWILYHVARKSFSGMKWYNQDQNMIQISWKHRSAGAWCREDVEHFESWAYHTGRHSSDSEFKRWKANFRCALNILPEIDEVKELKNSKGKNPYKVYRINECQARQRKRKASSSQVKQTKPRRRQMIREEEPQDTDDSSTVDETEMAVEQILNNTPGEEVVPTSRLPSILPPITLTTAETTTTVQQRLYYSQTSQPYSSSDGSFLTISTSHDGLVVPTWAQPESELASRRNISLDCGLQGLDLLQSQQLPPMEIFQSPFDENSLNYCGLQALTPVDEMNIYPEVGLFADLISFQSEQYQPLQDVLLQSELRSPSILEPVTPESPNVPVLTPQSPNAPVLPLFVTQMNEELL